MLKYNVLLTGSTGGLGTALGSELKKHNFTVYSHSHLNKSDIQTDFTDICNLHNINSFIQEHDINCIINNAGVYSNKDFTDLTDKEILDIFNINLISPVLISRYLYKYLSQNKKPGLIVNINSLAGKFPNYNESIYCATKFGLSGFGSSLSINKQKTNINIIDCYLGALNTKMNIDRGDCGKLIDPIEAAQAIVQFLLLSRTGMVSSFEYRRI